MAEAELTTIARPYARAAFSCALDQSSGLATWSKMLGMLAATVSNKVVREALDDPALTHEEESQLVVNIMGDDLTEEGRNLLSVLGEYGRISVLPEISELFEHLKTQHEQTMDVRVTSAFEVDEADQTRLANALQTRLQKKINLTTDVDASLMGGVVIRADDTVIDNSVRGKLEKLAQTLD